MTRPLIVPGHTPVFMMMMLTVTLGHHHTSRRCVPSHKYATTKESFIKMMMESYQRARERQHEQRLDLLACLHNEKMEMFGGLFEAIKGLTRQS